MSLWDSQVPLFIVRRRPSTLSKDFASETTKPFVANFICSIKELEDEKLFKWSCSHEQHGCHALNGRNLKNLLQNQLTDDLSTKYV